MSEHIAWHKGGTAAVIGVTGDAVVLRSTTPAPPGARLEGEIMGEQRSPLRMKVRASRRQSDGSFLLEGRLLDVRREQRAELTRLAADTHSGRPPA